MNKRYIVEQANFVIAQAVNQFNIGNSDYGIDTVEANHLHYALEKEGLLSVKATKVDVSNAIIGLAEDNDLGVKTPLTRFDIEEIADYLDEEGLLAED